ncbi:MAG: HAD-IA family hydrolase [Nannocystaceae bacterium]
MATAILFDLIGVLAEPSWRELVALPRGRPWDALKTGVIEEAAFWPATAAATYRRVLALRADRLDLARHLRGRGHPIYVASNFALPWIEALRARPGAELFDGWFVSAELGVAKPDPRFFARARAQVGVDAILVADQEENCAAARGAGLRAIWAWPGRDLGGAIEAELTGVSVGDPSGSVP